MGLKAQLSSGLVKPKHTPDILNLQRRMYVLGVQGRYVAAKKLQKQVQHLINENERKLKENIANKYKARCEAFKAKQKKELAALLQKLDSLEGKKKVELDFEFSVLEKRQRKEMDDLIAKQSLEKAKYKLS